MNITSTPSEIQSDLRDDLKTVKTNVGVLLLIAGILLSCGAGVIAKQKILLILMFLYLGMYCLQFVSGYRGCSSWNKNTPITCITSYFWFILAICIIKIILPSLCNIKCIVATILMFVAIYIGDRAEPMLNINYTPWRAELTKIYQSIHNFVYPTPPPDPIVQGIHKIVKELEEIKKKRYYK